MFGSRLVIQNRTAWIGLVTLVTAILCLTACADSKTYQEWYEKGKTDSFGPAKERGFQERIKAIEEEAYRQECRSLIDGKRFSYNRWLLAAVAIAGACIGFMWQRVIILILQRWGVLNH